VEMLTLVIIEDEESHFDLMKRAIAGKFPYASVYHFQEAETCLERLDEINPTVIITDYLMPGMDGIEFLEVLNQTDIDIPVIMITGHGDENVAVRAMKLGAKDYLQFAKKSLSNPCESLKKNTVSWRVMRRLVLW